MMDSEADMAEVLANVSVLLLEGCRWMCRYWEMMKYVSVQGMDEQHLVKMNAGLKLGVYGVGHGRKLLCGAGWLLVQEGAARFLYAKSWRTPTVNFVGSLPGFLSCPFPRLSIPCAFSLLLQRSC